MEKDDSEDVLTKGGAIPNRKYERLFTLHYANNDKNKPAHQITTEVASYPSSPSPYCVRASLASAFEYWSSMEALRQTQ